MTQDTSPLTDVAGYLRGEGTERVGSSAAKAKKNMSQNKSDRFAVRLLELEHERRNGDGKTPHCSRRAPLRSSGRLRVGACRCLSQRERRGIALLAALLLTGCSDPTVGTVSGTVTVDGSPVKLGSIAFFPVDGRSSTSGAEIVDGQYTATVAPGTARVEIHVPKVIGQRKAYDTPDSPMMEIVGESLPAKYNDATELTLDVTPGEIRQDYELTTK